MSVIPSAATPTTPLPVPLGSLSLPDPGTAHPRPAVVLVPDVWGLTDFYRELARRLAAEGVAPLALDPYGAPVEIRDPGAWLRSRSDPEMLARIRSAVEFLASHAEAGGPVGILGFCIGGTYSLLSAAGVPGIQAAVAYYGILSYDHGLLHDPAGRDTARKPRAPIEAAPDLACPVLAIFGADDEFVPVEDVRALEAAAPADRLETHIYPGAGHAFLNETRPTAYRPEAARDAWARAVAFLRERLVPYRVER